MFTPTFSAHPFYPWSFEILEIQGKGGNSQGIGVFSLSSVALSGACLRGKLSLTLSPPLAANCPVLWPKQPPVSNELLGL